ncbi:tetratricopeptide repeat protein [Streptomyces albicerus]|uniref:tetratricopeptide repeat protein n=1 Tax=Streptomyces albicerus TaxID=2569859 RepID=UPI00124AF406|nr:tetratricopeptide repeat protein [Streptomyces albicerus]
MSETIDPPHYAPIPPTLTDLLERGRGSAEAGDWVAAGHAWVQAAMRGSEEGANLASQVTGELVPLADAGSAEAAALLAGILMDYYDESALPTALMYAKASAEAGNPAGQRTYGFMLVEGHGAVEDPARAAELFRAAAEGGDAYAAYNLANMVDDHDECVRVLERAAGQGVAEVGAALADRLSSVDRDEEALRWYLWAAERGHTGSMNAAACWYRDGFGTSPDPVQAVRWYFAMLALGDGNGIHEAIELVKRTSMTEDQIREAGRLAAAPATAEALISTVAGKPLPGHGI